MDAAAVIPAVKKNVAFPDDLVKKLAGVALIERAIEMASQVCGKDNVYVVTDSEEIRLRCDRAAVNCLYDPALNLRRDAYLESLRPFLVRVAEHHRDLVVISPYAPLLDPKLVRDAVETYVGAGARLLIPVERASSRKFEPGVRLFSSLLDGGRSDEIERESHAFTVFNRDLLTTSAGFPGEEPMTYEMPDHVVEIESYQDWWICEKLLERRRIVFRIIGDKQVGMGHIYRCLALAHEISDHEIRFVCDTASRVASNQLAGYDYWLSVHDADEIEAAIIALEPDLVVNDILDTEVDYVRALQCAGARVVNFEDLGAGASVADLTINDLYDRAVLDGGNIRWGQDYVLLRDEFTRARPNEFREQVRRVLVAFGGTDPNDLTRTVLTTLSDFCAGRGIAIDVVTGSGYGDLAALQRLIPNSEGVEITHTHATEVISSLMERAELAVVSNGRTVHELAHMNVPAVVIAHHEREAGHGFAAQEHGFVALGTFERDRTPARLEQALTMLVDEVEFRRELFSRQQPLDFVRNKARVVRLLLDLIEAPRG